jgi:hypothetical protein
MMIEEERSQERIKRELQKAPKAKGARRLKEKISQSR